MLYLFQMHINSFYPCLVLQSVIFKSAINMIEYMIAHTGYRLLLRLASIQDLMIYLDSDVPLELQKALVKKTYSQLSSVQEKETHPLLDSLHQRISETIEGLVETVENDTAPLSGLQKQLDKCSVLLNKYVTLPTESQSQLKTVISHLLALIRALTGVSAPTAWSQALNTDFSLKQSVYGSIIRFLSALLAAYPKNDSFNELYEGTLWDLIAILAPICITTNMETCLIEYV